MDIQSKRRFVTLLLILGFPLWFPLLAVAFCILLSLATVIATLTIVMPWSLVLAFGASALGLLVATAIILVGDGIVAALLVFGAALVLGALCIFVFWVALHLAALGSKCIYAMFNGTCKLIFGRR